MAVDRVEVIRVVVAEQLRLLTLLGSVLSSKARMIGMTATWRRVACRFALTLSQGRHERDLASEAPRFFWA